LPWKMTQLDYLPSILWPFWWLPYVDKTTPCPHFWAWFLSPSPLLQKT
jgi:hypothetical protein